MAVRSKRKIQKNILSMIREHDNYRRFVRVVIPVALVLMLTAYWAMHMNAISMSSTELVCAIEEHTHTTGCYAWVSADGSVLGESGSGTVVTADTELTEDIESTESITDTESVDNTELTTDTESTENTESTTADAEVTTAANETETFGESESITVAENTKDTETTEDTEATGNTESTEDTEDSEATESKEESADAESAEESETTQYVLPTNPKVGDTITVNGVEYAYTLTCTKEEHTHTDSCYSTDTGSETETDEGVDGDDDTSVLDSNADSSGSVEDSGDASGENTTSTNAGIMLTSSADDTADDDTADDDTADTGSTDTSSDSLTATASSGESITYTASDVTYDESTGDFTTYLKVAFVFNEVDDDGTGSSYYIGSNYDADIVNDSNYTTGYRITLPEGVIVPSSLINGSSYNGYLEGASDTVVFKYYFEPYTYTDESSGEEKTGYYIYIVFLNKDDLKKSGYNVDSTLEGYVEYWGTLSSDAYNAEGDVIRIYDSFTENLAIEVTGSQITYDGNSTMTEDISVVKSGSYDSSSNTITYTLTVYSKKGTGATIEITDAFADSGFAEILKNDGVLTSISCVSTTVSYTTYQNVDYGVTAASGGTEVKLNDGTTSKTVPYYYTDSEGTIHIMLDGLKAYSDSDTTSNAYVITYTYTVNPDYQTTYSSTNSVTASTDYTGTGYEGTISDTETATVYVTGTTVLKKTGAYDSSSGEITWTITVGDGSNGLAGFVLTDDMITDLAASDIKITDTSDSNTAVSCCYAAASTDESGNVTYIYYSDAAMTSVIAETTDISSAYAIVYVLDASTTTTGTSGTEHPVSSILFNSGTQYTITYTTSVDSVWTSQTVTNTAELTYEGDDEDQEGDSYSSSYSMYISGSGSNAFTKTFDSAEETTGTDGNTTLLTLTWKTTFTVPTTGIPEGLVFTDYVSDSSGSTSQYMTYDQASKLAAALEKAWGSGNISIEFCTNSNYYSTWTTDWVSTESLDSSGDTVYYQFRITVLNDIEYDNGKEISYTYSTTAAVSGYDTNTYYNTITDGSNSKSASYTWYKRVAKYGTDTSGNISNGSATSISTSADEDGNVTVAWIVRLVVDDSDVDDSGAHTYTYTVTDKLPEGVSLSALQVSQYGNSNYKSISITNSASTMVSGVGTFVYTTETTTDTEGDSVQTVKLTISDIASGVSMLYLKYTCTYAVGEDSEGESYELGNRVAVTVKGSDSTEANYGDASQTTTVTIPTTSTSTEDMTKEKVFDSANNVLTYTVDINPDAETYTNSEGDAYADLTVTDTLTYYTYPGMGMLRSATLITSSLQLIDVESGEELDSSEYSWTYSETSTVLEWAASTYGEAYTEAKIITLTVPNSMHLKLVYQYSFTIIQSGTWTEYNTNATNSAVLSGESETMYSTPGVTDSNVLSEILTYGAASSGSVSYTIYKVDEDDFAQTLSGATFTLYAYDSDSSNFIAVGDYTTGSSGSVSITGTPTFNSDGEIVSYTVKVPNQEAVEIPVDTICFFVESSAPDGYKLDSTKYYFYYGSSVSKAASGCDGYTSSAADAKNMVISGSIYITNEHSSDYYAAKTSISVIKTWFDANGEEYEKSDGSITFNLYRILKLNDGTITNSSLSSNTSGSTSSGSSSDGSVYLTWSLAYNDYSGGYPAYESGTTKVTDGTATITVTYSDSNEGWYTPLQLIQVTDSGMALLATAASNHTWCYTIYDSIVTSVEYTNGAYVFTLQNITDSMEIMIYSSEIYAYSVNQFVYDAEVTSSSDTSSSGSSSSSDDSSGSSTDSSSGDGDTSSSDDTSGTVYRLNFSDLYEKEAFLGEDGNYGDLGISGNYGWTDDDSSHEAQGFFSIEGTGTSSGEAHLSVTHGTASYDIDGDGEVDDGETDMDVCLKMENDAGTAISFTSEEGGYLTMVFNSEGNGNSVKLTNTTTGDSEVLTPSTSLYVIYEYVTEGSYKITYNKSCYLFYIAFDEGEAYVEDDTDTSIHNFNNGTDSVYYTIAGSPSYNYGTVSYDDIIASQCLKMNSSASITFTSEEAGTIYLIMTNPKASSKVGVTLDGEEVYATATTTADSKGYRIYTIMQRVDAGTHKITRINGTEVMLYYIAYMADDYDGKTWADDAEDSALAGLLTEDEDDDQEVYNNYNNCKELVDTITISASSDWSWYSATLPSEYVDTDTGTVLGEYYYFVVETQVNGVDVTDSSSSYKIQYLNDDGINYGSIGIGNRLTEDSDESTSITLQKSWEDESGNALSIGSADADTEDTYGISEATITYGLYAVMNLTDTSALTEGDSISRTFTTVESDTFYTVTGSTSKNGTTDNNTKEKYGDVIYGDTSTETGLKMNSGGSVTFDAPATNGTLTLVFSTYNKNSNGNITAYYGPNFTITGPDNISYKYVSTYDSTNKTVTISFTGGETDPYSVTCTSYSGSDNAAVFTLALASAGTYKVTYGGTECYLHYIEYAYQYCNLVDGILIQTGTLSVDDTITDSGSDTDITWAKEISGLPLNIYSEDEDSKQIGTYSYYVKETGISITVDGETYDLEYDSDKEAYIISYMVDKTQYKYIVKSSMILTDSSTSTTTTDPISSGSIEITNVLSLSTTDTGSILPATGGLGRREFYVLAAMLMGLCATMLLTHLHLESVRRRKRRRG